MLHRASGQFGTTYRRDQALFSVWRDVPSSDAETVEGCDEQGANRDAGDKFGHDAQESRTDGSMVVTVFGGRRGAFGIMRHDLSPRRSSPPSVHGSSKVWFEKRHPLGSTEELVMRSGNGGARGMV